MAAIMKLSLNDNRIAGEVIPFRRRQPAQPTRRPAMPGGGDITLMTLLPKLQEYLRWKHSILLEWEVDPKRKNTVWASAESVPTDTEVGEGGGTIFGMLSFSITDNLNGTVAINAGNFGGGTASTVGQAGEIIFKAAS